MDDFNFPQISPINEIKTHREANSTQSSPFVETSAKTFAFDGGTRKDGCRSSMSFHGSGWTCKQNLHLQECPEVVRTQWPTDRERGTQRKEFPTLVTTPRDESTSLGLSRVPLDSNSMARDLRSHVTKYPSQFAKVGVLVPNLRQRCVQQRSMYHPFDFDLHKRLLSDEKEPPSMIAYVNCVRSTVTL